MMCIYWLDGRILVHNQFDAVCEFLKFENVCGDLGISIFEHPIINQHEGELPKIAIYNLGHDIVPCPRPAIVVFILGVGGYVARVGKL